MVTDFTLADAEAARPPSWALMALASACPSCSRLTRLAVGVLASKNAVQLAVMALTSAELPDDVAGADEAGEVAGEVAGADEADAGAEFPDDPPPPLLPHAATLRPSAHASIKRMDLCVPMVKSPTPHRS